MTLSITINPFFIFFVSLFNKKATWKITTFDLICGGLSVLGLLLWALTQIGNLAILLSILSDGLAGIPTIVKSYKAPETENYKAYLGAGLAAVVTLLTIKHWDFAHFGFPLYILIFNLITFPLIKFKLGKKLKL